MDRLNQSRIWRAENYWNNDDWSRHIRQSLFAMVFHICNFSFILQVINTRPPESFLLLPLLNCCLYLPKKAKPEIAGSKGQTTLKVETWSQQEKNFIFCNFLISHYSFLFLIIPDFSLFSMWQVKFFSSWYHVEFGQDMHLDKDLYICTYSSFITGRGKAVSISADKNHQAAKTIFF